MAAPKKIKNKTQKTDLNSAKNQAQVKLQKLEGKLDEVFVKNAPYQLPKAGKDWIVKYAPWIALIIGVIDLFAVSGLWRLGHSVNYANHLLQSLGSNQVVPAYQLGFFWWVSLVVLAIQAIMQIAAFPGLQARKKAGWNLLFYSALLGVLTGVIYLFVDGRGVGSFIWQLIGAAIGFYFLFQIRSYYSAKGKATK